MSVDQGQRFTRAHPCPICGGYDQAPRGKGVRCYGFLSTDGEWAHCTREEQAGPLDKHTDSETYAHKLTGECRCGSTHGAATPAPDEARGGLDVWSFDVAYDYRDEEGRLVHQTTRYSKPEKTFRQRQPLIAHPQPRERAHWRWKLNDVRTVLYRLPELLKSSREQPVFVCEGEKDADRLASLGLVATTVPMGAGKWRPQYAHWLKGRYVVLLADNDKAGIEGMGKIRDALQGVAAQVKCYAFKSLPEGGDVSDWLDGGGTPEKLLAMAQVPGRKRSDIIVLPDLLAREFPPVQWAIDGLLPEGLTLLAGKPKLGKSWLALGLSLAIASGGRALGKIPVERGEVLHLGLEDSERRLQTRCLLLVERANAPDTMHLTLDWPRVDDGGLDQMDRWLTAHPNTRLVVVDTLKRVRPLSTGKDQRVYDSDYEALQGMQELAATHHVAMVAVHHLRKMSAEDPLDAISGSTGLSAAADGLWIMQRTRGEHDATLYVVHREGEDQELALKWDAELTLWSLEGSAEDYRLTKERQEIIDTILEAGEAMTPKEVAGALEKNPHTTKNLIRKMAADGHLWNSGSGRYNVPPDHPVKNIESRSLRSPKADFPQQQAKTPDYAGDKKRSLSVVSDYDDEFGF